MKGWGAGGESHEPHLLLDASSDFRTAGKPLMGTLEARWKESAVDLYSTSLPDRRRCESKPATVTTPTRQVQGFRIGEPYTPSLTHGPLWAVCWTHLSNSVFMAHEVSNILNLCGGRLSRCALGCYHQCHHRAPGLV